MNTKINVQSKIPNNHKKIIIISHGFGSSINSPTAQMALQVFPSAGMGAVAFDFPGHGDSETYNDKLTITNCIDYISELEKLVVEEYPETEICYFSSSFGAFINTLYLCTKPHFGKKSFFRSAAVNMPELFNDMSENHVYQLKENGFVLLEEYEPYLRIPTKFIEEINKIDLFKIWETKGALSNTTIEMVHGECDETIDVNAAKKFAEISGSKITLIPSGEHRLMNTGEPEKVFELALKFFD